MAKKKKTVKKAKDKKKSSKRKSARKPPKAKGPHEVVWVNGSVHIDNRDFKPGPGARLNKVEAKTYGAALYDLASSGVDCTPENIVSAASQGSSPLNPYFDWVNKVAADKWRIEQAKYLCRSIIVIDTDARGQMIESPIMISIQTGDRQTDRRYFPTFEVMSDPDMRQQALINAANDLRHIADKYQYMKVLAKLCNTIRGKCDSILSGINKERKHQKRPRKIYLSRHRDSAGGD
ncbi:hypothetical protein LCGC14_0516700 [marine sediment metagenome]|uniref:Uncharacterized protein n=1 Tax=marine sediment metagenome TaxID=412755 RepID=A0A0F9SI73_9ZZZZ